MTTATALRPPPHCHDCEAIVGIPSFWDTNHRTWLQLCAACWDLRDLRADQENAVLLAETICAIWLGIAAAEMEAGRR